MWVELGHSHFLYVPVILNVVTTRKGTGTKNISKGTIALRFWFSIQSSLYCATSVAKVSLSSIWTQFTVSFHSI